MQPTKYIFLAGVLSIAIIGFGIYTGKSLKDTSRGFESQINRIETAASAGDWEKAKTELREIKFNLSKSTDRWSLLMDHLEIDNIENAVNRLESHIESRNASQALVESASLKYFITHIPERESFNLKNIL